MFESHILKAVLSHAGCAIPLDVNEDELKDCYLAMERLSSSVDFDITKLKRQLWAHEYDLFLQDLAVLKSLLTECFANMLAADCEFIMDNLKAKKYVIAETMMERLGSSVSAFSISYQTARFKAEHMSEEQLAADDKTLGKDQKAEEQSEQQSEAITMIDKPMILAVDDNPEILNTLKGLLGGRYRFYGVTSGKAALKFLEIHKPDLFLFDIDMPEMNGFELANQAHISETGKPLVFLTSNANATSVRTALSLGAADFIVKPCDENIILPKLRSILAQARTWS